MPNLDYHEPESSIALPCTRKLIRYTISAIVLLVLCHPLLLHAADASLLLGNTEQSDRLLLREISDQYTYTPSEAIASAIGSTNRPEVSGRQAPQITPTTWELVQQSQRLQIPDQKLVSLYREQYRQEARWISRVLQRASPFVGHVVDELHKRYLPLELALLPVIESGYRPNVHSAKNAAGIWQIIPTTAADVGVEHTTWFDGRADIRQSTTAALDYLSYLNAEFHGDWLLTLAAYNAGVGRVQTSVKRNSQAGLPIDFWSLRLPQETRHYVPKFLALVAMLRYDNLSELEIPAIPPGSAFDLVDIRQRVGLDRLATLTGISEKKLRFLNAGLVRGITPPSGPHLVYVPQGVGTPLINNLIRENNLSLIGPAGSHRVVAGDTINSIAQRYNVPSQTLRQLNELESDIIRVGQTLWVLDNGRDSSHIEYVVTIGDTLSDIANRFSMRIADIRDERGERLANDVIHPGDTLSLLAPSQTSGFK